MLSKNNDQDLKNKNVDEIFIPFYQAWQELVDNRTLDVYQYRILNSLTSLIELDQVIDKKIEGLYPTNHNIECCMEETLHILNNDIIMDKYEKSLSNRLKSHLGKKTDKLNEQKALGYQIKYAIKELSPKYLNLLLNEVREEIDNKNINFIVEYSNAIISQCISNGWSSRALFDVLRHLRTLDTIEQKWEKFKSELINHQNVKIDVLIALSLKPSKGNIQEEIIRSLCSLGVVIKSYDELVKKYIDVNDIKSVLKKGRKYIQLEVDSPDIYSAAHLAIKHMSDKMNIASFYNLVGAWDLRSLVIVSINTLNKYHKPIRAEDLYKTYDYIDSSGNIFESTRQIFLDNKKKGIQDKLQGAFGYTNISRASLFQEEKYMNLWVALESLARTDMYSDIISNVKKILPAALCLRYVYRIVRNFAEDCNRCGLKFTFTSKTIDLKQSTKRNLVKEVITILQDDDLYQELKQKCFVNSLLLSRCETVRKLVNDVSYATNKIQNHYNRVKWQVQRLYRIRNEIAHSALQEKTSLIIYIEHLYDYLSIFISEIVTCIKDKRLDSLGEVYCVIKDNYDVFTEFAKSKNYIERDIIKETVLKTGVIDLMITDI